MPGQRLLIKSFSNLRDRNVVDKLKIEIFRYS